MYASWGSTRASSTTRASSSIGRGETEAWAQVVGPHAEQGREAYVYVNNHFSGHSPASARVLQRLLRQSVVEPEQLGEQMSLF